ncbi:MAG TPA: peptidyl-prolyl cis-trans isomerase [Phycisphaerales bacterium]|nr:peptidyl-prolyl cis-trans isomerase [Phycisphaerales bacterium]
MPSKIILGLMTCCAFAACQSETVVSGPARTVSVADFSASTGMNQESVSQDSSSVKAHSSPSSQSSLSGTTMSTSSSPGGSGSNTMLPPAVGETPESERTALRPFRPGDQVLVESVIGQVSGTPIFADKFFEPIADQLISESNRLDRANFMVSARRIVLEHLKAVVLNQVFLSEAVSSLTADEQKGLFYFLNQVKERIRNEALGQPSLADKESLEKYGMTADQRAQAIRDSSLINKLINERITPRIIVSWRDVENEYKLHEAEFNPPGSVTLSLMQFTLPADADKFADAQKHLADGEPFAQVADSLGFSKSGVFDTFKTGPGGISDIQVKREIRDALTGLSEGQTSAPIKLDSSDPKNTTERMVLVHVDKVDLQASKSIYDVQHEIYKKLYDERATQERNRFIRSIMAKGNYDEIDMMADRLVRVAVERYGK